MPLSPDTFRSLLSRFPSGVTVVTALDASGSDHGMTASAFCALSLEPPLVLVCIERTAVLYHVLSSAPHFAVNVLSSDQEPLSRRFSDVDEGRFDGLPLVRGLTGSALLGGVAATLECAVRERFPGGDHTIVIGEVLGGSAFEVAPLIHHRGTYSRLAF